MRTITAIFDRVKQDVSGRVTGKSIHNFKRIIDEKIAYGKQVDGLDAKTQSVLRGMRESARSFLEDRFPEYAAANLEYSKTIDVINRIQKAASKNADLDGDYAFSNLGRMSRAIMSQRQSRDAVLQAIDDMDVLAKRYGRNFQDDIRGQVWFANYLDDEFGSSRQTGFSGQVQQGVANAAADLATGSAGIDVKGFMNKIWTKRIEDKNKFKIMKQLLKDNP